MSKYDEQKGYGRALVHIFIDEDVKKAIKAQAKRHGLIMAKYIEQILRKHIDLNEKEKNNG